MSPSAGGTSMAYRVAVITDAETSTGFRLAGVEVREAADAKAALEHLRALVSVDYGLLAVNEDLLQGTADAVARLMGDRDIPTLTPFPAPKDQQERGED